MRVNVIDNSTYTECHCERSPAPQGVQGEVKQSHQIATPACRNALPTAARHFGVQARPPVRGPRNDKFLSTFTVDILA
jgi:hypothetical protein